MTRKIMAAVDAEEVTSPETFLSRGRDLGGYLEATEILYLSGDQPPAQHLYRAMKRLRLARGYLEGHPPLSDAERPAEAAIAQAYRFLGSYVDHQGSAAFDAGRFLNAARLHIARAISAVRGSVE